MQRHRKTATKDVSITRRVGRAFRSRLALTTVLTVVPFIGYSRQAFAACDPTSPSTYVCSGDSGRQTITADNANVTTVAGFSVYTDAGSGIDITGEGQLTFIDTNASSITSTDSAGLNVSSTGNDGEISGGVTIRTNGDIAGHTYGIVAGNDGDGDLEITADGAVSGRYSDGIFARNYGNDLTITTGESSVIRGGNGGIDARNEGSGNLDITANGQVTGLDGAGIYARNSFGGVNLEITTGAQSVITGSYDGIFAENLGEGDLDITVNGRVEGMRYNGIFADNEEDGVNLTVSTGAQSVVIGEDHGIYADNDGYGKLEVTVYGAVIGRSEDGIYADNSSDGTGLTITTGVGSVVWGDDDGIDAEQDGDGDLTITVDGAVTGKYGDGIYAENDGYGETNIAIGKGGLVEGDDSAIDAYSDDGQDISITNDGLVRNLSGRSDYLAIETDGGETEIRNNGNLIGAVNLGIGGESEGFNDDRLDNAGFWNTAGGANLFGGGDDEVTNSGTLVAANDATQDERTRLFGLETFNNFDGLISLADGAIGDRLELRGDGEGNSTYFASEGRLAVDAVLGGGAAGEADMLEIDGSVGEGGTTWISVNVVDALGANVLGIPVVGVSSGNTVEGDFQLAGPLNAGFYTWDLRYDSGNNVHELFTSGIGVGAYEIAAGITAAQDMWFQSTGTLLQRQADLRSLIAGMQVTPVADFAEPVEATPVAKLLPGFWMRGVGAWLERDDEQNGFTLDRKQTVFGGMAGFDFGTENVGGPGDALMFGLFGGYLSSDLDFKETNTEWSYEGPSLGVYASYLNGAFYADATVKADFLNISIDPEDLAQAADESDTDGLNVGAMVDAGYKFGAGGGVFFEPQATLALLHTSIDDVDVFGGTVEFDNETSLRGRLGLRLGYDHTASNAVVYSSDVTASAWQNFSGENGATIVDPLIPSFGVSDDPAQTYGDVSLGFSATAPEGWSGFVRGNYQFADDYEAFAGNAGVRVAW